jgi:chemotaxis receptor (MCP) glutamine deamidase CheD
LIYFDAVTQQKVVNHFGKYLRRDGYLMLGHSESLHGMSEHFSALGITVYRKLTDPAPHAKPVPVAKMAATGKQCAKSYSAIAERSGTSTVNRKIDVAEAGSQDEDCGDEKFPIIVGEILVSDKSAWITTLLGSCVAVCLYDEIACIAGMNHFMLPAPREPSTVCNRYGVHSMELLINSMMAHGADRRRLKAKVFGGCSAEHSDFAYIGINNVDFAHNFLEVEGIPVVSQFTNQGTGMYIEFHTMSRKVRVRMLDRSTTEIVARDEQTQASTVQAAVEKAAKVTLFTDML